MQILDTEFGFGRSFFQAWRSWQTDASRPSNLHYVALCAAPCQAQDLRHLTQAKSELNPLAHQLAELWHGLLPGFHRFLLDEGQVNLTLCVGEPIAMLRAQQFEPDTLALDAGQLDNAANPLWLPKAIARCCRRGTRLNVRNVWPTGIDGLRMALTHAGFRLEPENLPCQVPDKIYFEGEFDPHWTLKNTRTNSPLSRLPVQRCAVIGAGLAGASVAAALARRGWQVSVLDQAAEPAAGASGLPVGLVVPHVSSDDCTLSRLSRAGVRLMLQHAHALLQIHKDWAPSGVLEQQIGGIPKLPSAWPLEGKQWSESFQQVNAANTLGPGIWHHQGAWLKPAALVSAWLRQPGVTFQGHAKVSELKRNIDGWDLLDATGIRLCSAERVVFANAGGAFDLLQKMQHLMAESQALWQHLPKTQGMRGMLNWDMHCDGGPNSFPPFPVNGSGSMVPHIPVDGGLGWFMGSSYQPDSQTERKDLANQASNFEHLEQLLPILASQLSADFSASTLRRWKGTRCVTTDRLPAVGPLENSAQPSLWLCAGMGSRGLSFSVLCAELLAARFGAEPLPIEAKLAKSLDALRA